MGVRPLCDIHWARERARARTPPDASPLACRLSVRPCVRGARWWCSAVVTRRHARVINSVRQANSTSERKRSAARRRACPASCDATSADPIPIDLSDVCWPTFLVQRPTGRRVLSCRRAGFGQVRPGQVRSGQVSEAGQGRARMTRMTRTTRGKEGCTRARANRAGNRAEKRQSTVDGRRLGVM